MEGETVEFSPVLDIYPLHKKNFKDHGLEVPKGINERLEKYNYYLVNVPVTLVAAPGWGFNQLDCILEFSPDSPAQARPVAYQIFPKEEWESVVRASQTLNIGLDENLEFKTPDVKLKPVLSAGVGLSTRAGAGLVLGPFQYQVLRAKIISRGQGNVKVRWRLDGEEAFHKADPRLGILLQVPKEADQVVILGVLKASKHFHLMTAELRHVLQYVRERTRNFMEQGAPLANHRVWDISAQL